MGSAGRDASVSLQGGADSCKERGTLLTSARGNGTTGPVGRDCRLQEVSDSSPQKWD